ncbi:hypothetical protein DUNSADRAFT_12777 [Dunaliella salina]|uniref:Uncharacterized protein n=1 Tax=Dunaliella salina TaxID=3046 RepID=A0ABQ7GAM1_DUNSA|nr:hypothetical protein DUNSADRAFT_12777 [Dunaliella salina]|eukprot:KAF5831649.1 hypothetical protein DUNSADRAFT_12777 [Dunaliella salina]
MSTLCKDIRSGQAPSSGAPRWKRLVNEQEVQSLLSSVHQGVPLLPECKEPLALAPRGINHAEQWFSCLPQDTAKSIVNLRRAQLYSYNAQAQPENHDFAPFPPAAAAARPGIATLEAAEKASRGFGARVHEVFSRQPSPHHQSRAASPQATPGTSTEPSYLGSRQLFGAAPAATQPQGDAYAVSPAAPLAGSSPDSTMQPSALGIPLAPGSMSPLRRHLQPPQPSPNSSPLRGLDAGPWTHWEKAKQRTKNLFAGPDKSPVAAALRPPNTRPTALGPGSTHSAPTLMPVQQVCVRVCARVRHVAWIDRVCVSIRRCQQCQSQGIIGAGSGGTVFYTCNLWL